MSTNFSGSKKLLRLQHALRERGVMRAGELVALGVSREYLRKLVARGILERIGHGLYRLPDNAVTPYHSLVEASQRVPHGVICLLSALRFHQVTTQAPHEVWVAIDRRAWHPHVTDFPLRLVNFSGSALTEGMEEHLIEGVAVRVYSLAKTVADCFKYRNKIGLDVALEALRDSLRAKRVTVDALWHFAKVCRVSNVMRPYLEAMV
ncbi:MAG: type IV toxin-antitoxin system AbiEi family antitoxin domain-containing protein [Armatimonadota bacterium]